MMQDFSFADLENFIMAVLDSCNPKDDIHTKTASLMYEIPEAEVTTEQRRIAKILNYKVLYG